MLWTVLLACPPMSRDPDPKMYGDMLPEGHVPIDEKKDAQAVRPVPLPEPPFTARTRLTPITLVDKHGAPLLVLDQVGVEVEVHNLLSDRAWVTCTGCRAPLEAWIQRSGLHSGKAVGDGRQDEFLSWLSNQEDLPEVAMHGFVLSDGVWIAPPWYSEGGYSGEVLRIDKSDLVVLE